MAKPNKVLIELRRKRGESQKTAAKNIGITQSMLAMLETGDRRGSDATKMAIANYYGVSVEHIFFGSNITNRDKEDK
ncbi:XRE family transcriptional regulator [Limosilactobacillus fermentum]|uniref:helix-turn-helix transcriptional regulator n=1 Tax=Limosilactobacillus fermentum TaxID=1613 RepID=UPI0021A7716B|nr:helix-turn-helix transcriptional regulator [Limosilactobacillus fermentum]MCT3452013.1 XRE family transcriptional regulator [Limosilactobacillus fermentum]